ncbi:hypothetical protein [Pseudolabrys sp.]|uniref:hypothetical protein n=1 Tax=Pseudolabrys sp. TaxID=1960880 RepID=UPI003D0E5774
MSATAPAVISDQDQKYIRLAREIVTNLYDIETILKNNKITQNEWNKIQADPAFIKLAASEAAAWHSAGNTLDRTKLKAGAMIEEWLPEAYARMHDRAESLAAKTELAKLISRIAGVGLNDASVAGGGEGVKITINLGQDANLKFEKVVTPKVIEATPTRTSED